MARKSFLSHLYCSISLFQGRLDRVSDCPCHLKVTDWQYPITVGRMIRGVLFAGQRIIGDNKKELMPIFTAIKEKTDPAQHKLLKKIVVKEHILKSEAEDLKQTFVFFAKSVQQAVNEIHRARFETATQKMINLSSQYLAESLRADTPERFWEVLVKVINNFKEATGFGSIDIYIRSESRYIQKIGNGKLIPMENARHVPVHLCIQLPNDKLTTINQLKNVQPILNLFDIAETTYLYKYSFDFQDEHNISTIIIIRDINETKEVLEFAENYCRNIGLRTSISILFLE